LFRHKTFAVVRPLEERTVLDPGFEEVVVETYFEMLPFRRYLNRALEVDS
jgi:uncharacterized protein (DUF2461 family)